jgi:putative ABC transport system permease protein
MLLETFAQDVRIGLRVLVKERAFTFLAVTVLALGICGVTTQFSVVNGIMLRGFSFPNPQQLVDVQLINPAAPNPQGFFPNRTLAIDLQEIAPAQQSFSLMAGYMNGSTVNVTYQGTAQRYTGAYVTAEFFKILGVAPVLGRDFVPEDNRPGAEKVAIISHQLWERDFGRDPQVIGQSVRLNGTAATIVGVMPAGFLFPVNEQIWVPLHSEYPPRPRADQNVNGIGVIGRLKPGVSLDQAQLEMTGFAQAIARANPDTNKDFTGAQVRPLTQNFVPPQLRQTLVGMLVAVAVVLLIACVNVMNMQFARATLRARELAIRGALGASRLRLIRQMLTESLLIATLGASVGVALSYWAVDFLFALTRNLAFPLPYWVTFDIDARTLAATVAVTVASAVFSGLVPAVLASRTRAAAVMKESARGSTSRLAGRITKGLVVFQLALTCALLIASTLQAKSIIKQSTIDYGYDESAVMTARLGLFDGDYPTPEAKRLFFRRLLQQLRAHPEIESAALTGRFRMTFSGLGQVEIDGQTYPNPADRPTVNFEPATEGYFETLGLRIVEGRDFTADDNEQRQPVAIVNASFARRFFGNESPIGRRFRTVGFNELFGVWRTIVGVVPDTRMPSPNNPQQDNAGFYIPLFDSFFGPAREGPNNVQFSTIVIRPRGRNGDSAATLLRREVAKVDANLPLYFVATPKTLHDEALGQNRIITGIFAAFGLVAVVLASVGLYGVMSFSVNQRRQEFGIRMALGADAQRILRMVVHQGSLQLATGIATGVGAALIIFTLSDATLQNLLFQVSPRDPLVYGSVIAVVTVVSSFALLIPARRATQVDPMIALRAE